MCCRPPSDTIKTLVQEFPVLLGHAGITVMEALAGMGISFVIGILIGILIDAMPTFKKCIYPILVVSQTVPVIVLAPIFIIYLGFGYAPKILTVAGEWIASQSDLGYYLIRAKNGYMLDKVFACVVMIILLSLLMNGLVKLFGRAFTPGRTQRG